MMAALEARGERAGARRVARTLERLEAAVRDEVPDDVRVAREGAAVVLSGRGLRARMLEDARLRGLGLLVRDVS